LFRKLALLTTGALALSSLAIIAPAGAATPPADGTLDCNLDGDAYLKPTLPSAEADASPKAGKIQVKKASVSACTGAVTGGKAEITGGVLDMKSSTSGGGSCTSLASHSDLFENPPVPVDPNAPLLVKPVVKVKLTGLNSQGKTMTVATLTLIDVVAEQGATGFTVTGQVKGTVGKNAFAGRTVTANISLSNLIDLLNCVAGSDNPVYAATAATFYGLLTGGGTPTPAPLDHFGFQYDPINNPLASQSTISIA